jgi:hypothetical protein
MGVARSLRFCVPKTEVGNVDPNHLSRPKNSPKKNPKKEIDPIDYETLLV